jgi:hypothetical protein
MPRTAINYQNTIIYKIVCKDINNTDIYVGHTTNFTNRKRHHKECINPENPHHKYKLYQTIKNIGGWDNWDMIEIEKYPCNDENEAKKRERFWFEEFKANLNMRFPIRDKKEYTDTHKNEKQEYDKNRRLIQFNCECGSTIKYSHKSDHLKTIKHLKYLESL